MFVAHAWRSLGYRAHMMPLISLHMLRGLVVGGLILPPRLSYPTPCKLAIVVSAAYTHLSRVYSYCISTSRGGWYPVTLYSQETLLGRVWHFYVSNRRCLIWRENSCRYAFSFGSYPFREHARWKSAAPVHRTLRSLLIIAAWWLARRHWQLWRPHAWSSLHRTFDVACELRTVALCTLAVEKKIVLWYGYGPSHFVI